MLIRKDLVVFLIGQYYIRRSYIDLLLDDFVDCKKDVLTKKDFKEVGRLRKNYDLIRSSYLYDKIRPFATGLV